MHRHLITLFLLIWLISFNSFSQVRHVKGIDMWGINAGIMSEGQSAGISWQKYFERFISTKIGGSYEFYYIPNFKYNFYSFNTDALYTILSNKKNLYFNLSGGIVTGFDRLFSENISLEENQFVFGEKIGLNAEFFLIHSIKIDLGVSQRFFQKKQNESMGIIYEASIYFKL